MLIDDEAEEDENHWHWQCNYQKTGLGSKTETATAKWNLSMFFPFIKETKISFPVIKRTTSEQSAIPHHAHYIGLEYVALNSFILYRKNFEILLKISDAMKFRAVLLSK